METTYQHLSELINPQATIHSAYHVDGLLLSQNAQYLPETIQGTSTNSDSSLFTSHLLPLKQNGKPIEHNSFTSDWMFIVLYLCLSLVALIRMIYTRKIRILFLSPFSSRYMSQVARDNDLLTPTLRFYLLINYLAMSSLASYLLIYHFIALPEHPFSNGFFLYGLIFTALSILYMFRIGLATFWGHLFKEYDLSYKYKLNHHLMSITTGLVMIPLLCGILYLPSQWFQAASVTGVILIGLLYITRMFKAFIQGLQIRWYAIVYIFLYLCSLEILPVLLLVKTLAKLDPA